MKRLVTCSLIAVCFAALSAGVPQSLAARRGPRDHAQTQFPADNNFKIGVQRYNDGDYDGAIDAFLQSVYFARNNYQPIAQLWLGKSYMAKHEDVKAIDALKKSIEQNLGGSAEAHILLAECYLRNDRDKEAEQECFNAMNDTLGRAYKAHLMLGKVYEKEENWNAAQTQFIEALGDKPWTYTEAWMSLAECKMKQQNWVGALQEFRAMIMSERKLHGINYEQIYLDLGICLVAKGDHQGAMDNWHRVLDYNPRNAEAHLQLGMLFDAENHISSAINEYKEFIRVSTDDQKISRAKERIAIIEQKLAPMQDVAAPGPSPYQRQQIEHQRQAQQQRPVPGESGF